MVSSVSQTENSPPEGGFRAWMIVVASAAINGTIFGVINNFSLIKKQLQATLKLTGSENAITNLVGSLAFGMLFLASSITGILTVKIGYRMTTFLGILLATSGLLSASFANSNVILLYLFYGLIFGMGSSLAYVPSLAILGHYFKRHLSTVNGLVTAGSSLFSIAIPFALDPLIEADPTLSLPLKSLAALTSMNLIGAFLFKPRLQNVGKENYRQEIIEFSSIWENKKYLIWIGGIAVAMFGYYVPYAEISNFIDDSQKVKDDKSKNDKAWALACLQITSGISRIFIGYIADNPRINKIYLQQISFLSLGILTMLLTVTRNFYIILGIMLGMGLSEGIFISLLGTIVFDLCGKKYDATKGIGCLFGAMALPVIIGPCVADIIIKSSGSYTFAFLMAGSTPLLGMIILFFVKNKKRTEMPTVTIGDFQLENQRAH